MECTDQLQRQRRAAGSSGEAACSKMYAATLDHFCNQVSRTLLLLLLLLLLQARRSLACTRGAHLANRRPEESRIACTMSTWWPQLAATWVPGRITWIRMCPMHHSLLPASAPQMDYMEMENTGRFHYVHSRIRRAPAFHLANTWKPLLACPISQSPTPHLLPLLPPHPPHL